MKTLFSISVLLFILFGCSEGSNLLTPIESNVYRQIAYNSLDESTKQSINEDWQVVPVYSGKYHSDKSEHKIIFDSKSSLPFVFYDQATELHENQVLVAVTFHTINDPLLGPTTTIIDYKSKIIIGGVLRY